MFKIIKNKSFANGEVYALRTEERYPIETTDTFLPIETKECDYSRKDYGSRAERWMIGVSCMAGCPVGCKFCATGQLKIWRNLTASEIVDQVEFIIDRSKMSFMNAKEHKINYTRMGEPFLNIEAVKEAIYCISLTSPEAHHYVSTIGIKGSDFSWIKDNITLQISVHSLDEKRRNELIPLGKKLMTLKELGQIRTESNLKTTVNLTLVDKKDFDIDKLKEYFDPEYFFIKLSPINPNKVSESNNIGKGVINGNNY